jgi:hypothetical protein
MENKTCQYVRRSFNNANRHFEERFCRNSIKLGSLW